MAQYERVCSNWQARACKLMKTLRTFGQSSPTSALAASVSGVCALMHSGHGRARGERSAVSLCCVLRPFSIQPCHTLTWQPFFNWTPKMEHLSQRCSFHAVTTPSRGESSISNPDRQLPFVLLDRQKIRAKLHNKRPSHAEIVVPVPSVPIPISTPTPTLTPVDR